MGDEVDFTKDAPRLEADRVTPDDVWRYARLAVTDAEDLGLTGVPDETLRAAWVQAADMLEQFIAQAPRHSSARDARLLAARARVSAGQTRAAVTLCLQWMLTVNTAQERAELLREAVDHARSGLRAAENDSAKRRAEDTLLMALEAYQLADPAGLEGDERSMALHEAGERYVRRGDQPAADKMWHAVLQSRPTRAVAESAASSLLEPLREAERWDAFLAMATEIQGATLARAADEREFRALMKEQIASGQLHLGHQAQDAEKWDEATRAFDAARRAGASGVSEADLAYQTAYAALEAGRADAEQLLLEFSRAHARDVRAPRVALVAAVRADERGDVDLAAERYKAVVERWPTSERAWEAARRLGDFAARDRQPTEAGERYAWAWKQAPPAERAGLERRAAEQFDLAGRDRDATAWYDRLLGHAESEREVMRELMSAQEWVETSVRAGFAAERAGQKKRAERFFRLAVQIGSESMVQGSWIERAKRRLAQ